jgi:hypothetical protein
VQVSADTKLSDKNRLTIIIASKLIIFIINYFLKDLTANNRYR